MMFRPSRLMLSTLAVGIVLAGIFAFMLVQFRTELYREIRRTVIARDAAVLHPVARQQIAATALRGDPTAPRTGDLLAAVLQNAQQEGVLAVAVYDAQGTLVRALPATLLFAELAAPDYVALLAGGPISRYYPEFPLDRYFAGVAAATTVPVLEVLLPFDGRTPGSRLGFAQYYLDARTLGRELDAIEGRLRRQTAATLLIGILLIAVVLALAYFGLRRAQRQVDERNARLARANFELTLAAKTSALGQLASHLIHGLQGSVAGLRAAVGTSPSAGTDWRSAVNYTENMQAMISEVVGLLGNASGGASANYELDGAELAALVHQRSAAAAQARNVRVVVENRLGGTVDGHRGSVLCLIAANLVHNAIEATAAGHVVAVELLSGPQTVLLTVTDQGRGIPTELRSRLFEPGATGRPGGSGLGLTISRLLARQIGGELELVFTGDKGTVFRVLVPRQG